MSVSPLSLPPAWSPLVENVPSPANEQSVLVAVTFEMENRKNYTIIRLKSGPRLASPLLSVCKMGRKMGRRPRDGGEGGTWPSVILNSSI